MKTLPTPNKLSEAVRRVIGPPFEWVDIPGGEVTLITEEGWAKNYIPAGKKAFTVRPLAMAKYVVSNAQYQAFIDAGGYQEERWWVYSDQVKMWRTENRQPRERASGGEDTHPRVNVCWFEAVAYCLWLSEQTGQQIRLPDEKEWQRAAQGDDGREYAWGNDAPNDRLLNYDKHVGKTTPVDSYEEQAQRSAYGLYNMSGNVFEWCLTDYGTGADDPGKAAKYRVVRGGSWVFNANESRTVLRGWNSPFDSCDFIGIRCARS